MYSTRLFYVVSGADFNSELFETKEEAWDFLNKESEKGNFKLDVFIAEVKDSYYEEDLKKWNYEDKTDAFKIIIRA